MKEFSKETINIDGKDYTLFLNRKGIVAWEKFSKDEKEKAESLRKKYETFIDNKDNKIDINAMPDDVNPFEGLEEIDDFENDKQYIISIYKRLYWIMLYTEHKLSISEASDLYDKACEEYGDEQVIGLGIQMVQDTNMNTNPNKELKNLKALKPKKN